MLLLPRYPIGLSKASSSAMHKAGKPQSCSVKGDPGERWEHRLTSSKVASWYQLDSLSFGTSSIMIFMENQNMKFLENHNKLPFQWVFLRMTSTKKPSWESWSHSWVMNTLGLESQMATGVGPWGVALTACLTMTQLVAFQSPRLVDGSACWPPGICWKGTMPLTAGELGYGRPGIAFREQTWHLAFPSTFFFNKQGDVLRFCSSNIICAFLCHFPMDSHGMFINPLGDEDSHHGNGQVHLVRRQGFHLWLRDPRPGAMERPSFWGANSVKSQVLKHVWPLKHTKTY